jgi:type II secretion system protein I
MVDMMQHKEQEGATLLEVLIALLILSMALVSTFAAMSAFTSMNTRTQQRSNAAFAARAHLEELRFTDPETMPSSGTQTTSTTVGLNTFTVVTEYCVSSGYCDDVTRHVVVTVQENGRDVIETETVFTALR